MSRPHAPVWLYFVTGAPGAGKSSVVQALHDRRRVPGDADPCAEMLVFDADWLLEVASELAGQDLTQSDARALWPAYRRVWLRILEMIARNGRSAILFTPMAPGSLPPIRWPVSVDWCLLDCDDATRTVRLRARGWTRAMLDEAIADAAALRGTVGFVIDTSHTTPEEAAARVGGWVAAHR